MSQDVSLSDKTVTFGDHQMITAQLNGQHDTAATDMKTLLWKQLSNLPPHLPVMDGPGSGILQSNDIQISDDQTLIDEHISFTSNHEPQQQQAVHNIDKEASNKVERRYNDSLVWCEDCQHSVQSRCSTHGPYTVVRDRVIPSRAKLTAPHFLSVRKVTYIAGGEEDVLGVFTRKVIQKRTQFGPYEGQLFDTWTYESKKRTDRIPLKLFFPDGSSKYYDCTDQSTCNWMMFVQPAKTAEEQNIVIYQHKGGIYFVSKKHIPLNTQLKAWYSVEYGKWMGKAQLPRDSAQEIIQELIQPSSDKEQTDTEQCNNDSEELKALKLSNYMLDVISAPSSDGNRVDSVTFNRQEQANYGDDEDANDMDSIQHSDDNQETDRSVKGNAQLRDTAGDNLTCGQCTQTFTTVEECQAHSCDATGMDDIDLGRRTLSKRKGRPLKIRTRRKRGRPKKTASSEAASVETISAAEGERDVHLPLKRRRGRPRKYGLETDLLSSQPPPSPESPQATKQRKVKAKRTPKPGQLHICDVCGKAFGKRHKLQIHIYSHTGEKPFKCSDCHAAFTSKYKLFRHQLIHSGGKKFVCFYCKKAFARKDHLKNHVRTHNPNKDNFKCDQCGKTYASSYCYRTHLTSHAIENNDLVCKVCQQNFSDKEELIVHLKIHKGSRLYKSSADKKHQCQFCNKMFFTKKDVKRHVVVHTKARDYLCQFCPQAFSRRDHLVRHVTHTHCSEVDADKMAPSASNGSARRHWVQSKPEESKFTTLQEAPVTIASMEGGQMNNVGQVQETFIMPEKQYSVLSTYNNQITTMRPLETIAPSSITDIVTQDHYMANSSVLLDGHMKQQGMINTINQIDAVMKTSDAMTYLPRQINQELQQATPVPNNYIPQYTIPEKLTVNPTSGAAAEGKPQVAMNLAPPVQPGPMQTTLIMSYGDAMKLLGATFPDEQHTHGAPPTV